MPSDLKASSLQLESNRDGSRRLHWSARSDLVTAGYRLPTVRLPYSLDDPADRVSIETACFRLQAEML